MKHKVFIGIFAAIIIVIMALGVVIYFHHSPVEHGQNVLTSVKDKKILFYGRECPHCKVLEKWFVKNKITKKILFVKKEVYHNRQNLNELIIIAKHCKLVADYIVVPFLWTGKKCMTGNDEIMKFFEGQLHEK